MGTKESRQGAEVMAEINITPFTDVLLVLLIIFMILAAIAAPPGFQKELAKTRSQPIGRDVLSREIQVLVSASNHIFIDGKPTSVAGLYGAMSSAIAFHKSHPHYTTHIGLIADRDARYDTIVKVMDAARDAGDDDVGFVTQ
jgi:biopolymer transport protein ExbD